jgi:hypothetical protein
MPKHVISGMRSATSAPASSPLRDIEIRNEFLIADSGLPDGTNVQAEQWPVGDLPDDAFTYLLGSRYCATQKLSD